MSDLQEMARALHLALSNNIDIQNLLGTPPRLYDKAPEDPVFPYLSYGAMRSQTIGGDETPLMSHQVTLHLWSRYGGRSEVLSLLSHVKSILENSDSLASYFSAQNLVSLHTLYSDVLRAPDGRTFHGLLRLSLITEN